MSKGERRGEKTILISPFFQGESLSEESVSKFFEDIVSGKEEVSLCVCCPSLFLPVVSVLCSVCSPVEDPLTWMM